MTTSKDQKAKQMNIHEWYWKSKKTKFSCKSATKISLKEDAQ